MTGFDETHSQPWRSFFGSAIVQGDHRLLLAVARMPVPSGVERVLRFCSLPQFRIPIAAVTLGTVYRHQGYRGIAKVIGAAATASAMANGPLKRLAGRRRPARVAIPERRHVGRTETLGSFPSGHAATSFAFAAAASTVHERVGVLALPAAAAVACSRVFVGDHYPLDILGGASLGSLIGVVVGRGGVTVPRPRPLRTRIRTRRP